MPDHDVDEDHTTSPAPSTTSTDPTDPESIDTPFQEWSPPTKLYEKQQQTQRKDDTTEFIKEASHPPLEVSTTKPLHLRCIRNPLEPLPCIMQVNDGSLFGSFTSENGERTVLLHLDAGVEASPKLSLELQYVGYDSLEVGWYLTDYQEDDWMLNHLTIARVHDQPKDLELNNPEVLRVCATESEWENLICMSFHAWPKILGPYFGLSVWAGVDKGLREALCAMFERPFQYHMRIWFLAPYEVTQFDRNCMSFFKEAAQRRVRPLNHWPDENITTFDDVWSKSSLQERELDRTVEVVTEGDLSGIHRPKPRHCDVGDGTERATGREEQSMGRELEDSDWAGMARFARLGMGELEG